MGAFGSGRKRENLRFAVQNLVVEKYNAFIIVPVAESAPELKPEAVAGYLPLRGVPDALLEILERVLMHEAVKKIETTDPADKERS